MRADEAKLRGPGRRCCSEGGRLQDRTSFNSPACTWVFSRCFAFELNLCGDVEISLRTILAFDSSYLSLVWSAFLKFRAWRALAGFPVRLAAERCSRSGAARFCAPAGFPFLSIPFPFLSSCLSRSFLSLPLPFPLLSLSFPLWPGSL